METIKTTAIVEDGDHLKLLNKFDELEKGSQVDLLIILKRQSLNKNNWRQVLLNVGTYTTEELSGFTEARKEFNKWQPVEF